MTLSRRRFLTISAAFACAPSLARAHVWQGHAFGGEVSLTLTGPRDVTEPAMRAAHQLIRQIEDQFSLYKAHSALSRLNATGQLADPDPHFTAVMRAADIAYHITDGLFDPTVQPLWQALASGGDTRTAMTAIGWHRVHIALDRITLAPGQALTFNGIAQGYATDAVADLLRGMGMSQVLVNIGEHRAVGGPYALGLHDPAVGALGTRTLIDSAIATSSPAAMTLTGGTGHILHPTRRPIWSTVSVEAPSATSADALSTALTFASHEQILQVKRASDLHRITLVDFSGDLITL